jgi:hypothetical protein
MKNRGPGALFSWKVPLRALDNLEMGALSGSCDLPDWLRHFQILPLSSAQGLNLFPGERMLTSVVKGESFSVKILQETDVYF